MLNKLSKLKSNYKHQAEDLAYLTDVNAANLYGVAIHSHIILWLSFSFVICAIIWANFATLDEVTRGSGKTIPSSHIQVIQNLEGGILSEILIKEGQLVNKGQALLQLDAVRFASSFNETKLKYYELLATTARLTAEVNKQELIIPEEVLEKSPNSANDARQLLASRQNELKANAKILDEQIRQKEQDLIELKSKTHQIYRSYNFLKEELKMSEPLVAEGAMSKVEILRLRRSANDLKGELTAARLSIPRIQSSLDEAKNKLSELEIRYHTEALEELNQAKAELERTTESVLALEDRVTRTRVLSPVKGTIKQLKVTTIGGVIQPGMDLVEIVPLEDKLLIEAEVRPADIAFLHPGQKAMVKLTAYDFSIYGGLEATLEHISPDTITNEEDGESYYLIRLRTNKNYLEKNGDKLNIIAGMTADVDILTGKKSVLDYILKPILKARSRALRER
ncbi:MAG: HlyD family type I secretion periplasmic adaptor subunit [Methylococcales bacterium]|nr:HlyD family type I secretion periplasmic adaptor subunit [Methylococcales bacterium]